jgi:hypothetical protein
MNSKSLGLIILALIVVVGGYFGYKRFATPAAAPAAPAVTSAMPEAAMKQLTTGIDSALGAIPGITPEQKKQASECAVKAVGAAMKPEDMAKLATDTAAQTAMMTQMATSMKECLTTAGVKMPG